jgi:hypothetical protein
MSAEEVRLNLVVALLAPTIIAYFALCVIEERSLLRDWVEQNHFQLLRCKRMHFLTGPFFWRSRKSTIFLVQLRDAQGVHRKGWVRFGPRFAHWGDTARVVEWKEDLTK